MLKICEIKTSVISMAEAESLAAGLLDARLAACVQVSGPGHSHYRWQAQLEQAEEYYLTAKTSPDRLSEAVNWLEEHHSYDVPEILSRESGCSQAYGEWVYAETRQTGVIDD